MRRPVRPGRDLREHDRGRAGGRACGQVAAAELDAASGAGETVFALLVALVGLFAVVRGFGPSSPADIVYYLALIGLLCWGIVTARRFAEEAATIT
jgi:hypothetical protein